MNQTECYLDTVFCVDKGVDVVTEHTWEQVQADIRIGRRDDKGRREVEENRAATQQQFVFDYCCLTETEYSQHLGSLAWKKVLSDSHLVDDATRRQLQ